MTTPHEEQPATEDRAAATPSISTAPPRSRWRFGNVPAHIGPARTSTVVIGVLFLVLFGLHSYLQTTSNSGYTTVTTDTGQRVRVPSSAINPVPSQAPPSAPTTAAPVTSAPAGTTSAARSAATRTPATTTATGSGSAAPRSTTASSSPSSPSSTVVPTPPVPTDTGTPTS